MIRPSTLSLISSFLVSGITTTVLSVFKIPGHILAYTFFLVFIVSFLATYIILDYLIFKNIRKIHNEIKSGLKAKSELKSGFPYADPIGALKNDFSQWLVERKEEIARLRKLENYRKEFLGNVSHELKTPIFNIQGYIMTLLDGGLEDKTINRDYLQRAEKSVERMINIIDDLESITQLETGELQLNIEKFDLSSVTKEVIESVEVNAGEKQIHLILGKYDENPVWVKGDKFRIRQVMHNLVMNSIKYGKNSGETKINFRDAGEKIMIEVADNGIGIANEHLPRIFERFYRIDKSGSRHTGGTGLGLSIVEHIVEAHGQTISVLSTPGVGTIFSFPLLKS